MVYESTIGMGQTSMDMWWQGKKSIQASQRFAPELRDGILQQLREKPELLRELAPDLEKSVAREVRGDQFIGYLLYGWISKTTNRYTDAHDHDADGVRNPKSLPIHIVPVFQPLN